VNAGQPGASGMCPTCGTINVPPTSVEILGRLSAATFDRDTFKRERDEAVALLRRMTEAFANHLTDQANDVKLKNADLLCPCFNGEIVPARAFLSRLTGEGKAGK
jgi:hypothetical protein